jgi:hypothetical protein
MNLTSAEIASRYRARHPERKVIEAAASKRYRERHPERAGVSQAKWRANNPEKNRASQLAWNVANPARCLINSARRRAKDKGISFDISHEDILPLPEFCPVLGTRLQYGPGRGRKLYENGAAASLDRVQNSAGYVRGNVVVTSLRANLLKGQATLEELQKIAAFYTKLAESVS